MESREYNTRPLWEGCLINYLIPPSPPGVGPRSQPGSKGISSDCKCLERIFLETNEAVVEYSSMSRTQPWSRIRG